MAKYGKRNFDILKFIELYKQSDVLWNISLNTYRRNDLKRKAYQRIADAMGGMEIIEVKKKIKALRGTYTSERKKVEHSQRTTLRGTTQSVYEPQLFWYNAMKFLDPWIMERKISEHHAKEESVDSTETVKRPKIAFEENVESLETDDNPLFEEESEETQIFESACEEELYAEEWTPLSQRETNSHQKLQRDYQRDQKLQTSMREYQKDEAAIYAEGWAISYRKLDETQKLFAKKAIDEIMILGQLKQLTLNSVQTTPNITNNFKFK